MHKVSFSETKLVYSYLEGRSQAEYANGVYSSMLRVKAGVPQGSVLGPFLFSVYSHDLPKIIKTCNIHTSMYADDVQLYTSCRLKEIHNCIRNINQDLKFVPTWTNKNNLCLNMSKTKFIKTYL